MEMMQLEIRHCCCRLKGHPLQVRRKQDWGRRFILLLTQAAVLFGSDADSDGVELASSFIIPNRQFWCSMWCPRCAMYGSGCYNVVCGLCNGAILTMRRRSETPFGHGRMEFPNTSFRAIELDPSCSGQAHFSRLGTGPRYGNTEPACILAVIRVTSIILQSKARMPSPASWFNKFRSACTNGGLDLKLSWRASEDPFKKPYKI